MTVCVYLYLYNEHKEVRLLWSACIWQAQTYLGVHYTREESEDMSKAVKLFKAAAAQKVGKV